ncbi:MAG TPA: type II CAAX endopeptidase family protein [Sphingomicrobium sp.]
MEQETAKPLWRRIVDYPLVAMVIAVVINIVATALGIGVGKLVPPLGRNWTAIVNALLVIIPVYITYKLIIVRLGDRPRDDLIWSRDAAKKLGSGLLVGFLIMAAAVAVAAILGVYRIVGAGDASRLVLELAMVAIIPGFTEELLFRGILFRYIEDWGGSWVALIVTSALFGLAHILNPNATWFSSFAIAVEAGLLLGGAYMLTRSLWFPMGLHAAWNLTQGEIFDVPVSGINEHGLVEAKMSGPPLLSGGQFGLEASLIALVLATALGLWIVWLSVQRDLIVPPRWVRQRVVA